MESIATFITDPTKVFLIPFIIARQAMDFSFSIMSQSFEFVQSMFQVML